MANRPIDRKTENAIFDMFEFQDRTAEEIAKELHLAQKRVSNVLSAFGCDLHKYCGRKSNPATVVRGCKKFRPLPDGVALDVAAEFKQGMTIKEIAVARGLGHERVAHAVESQGLDVQANRRARDAERVRRHRASKSPAASGGYSLVTPWHLAQVERLSKTGIDVFEIAYRVGNISSDAVYAHLSRLQVSA